MHLSCFLVVVLLFAGLALRTIKSIEITSEFCKQISSSIDEKEALMFFEKNLEEIAELEPECFEMAIHLRYFRLAFALVEKYYVPNKVDLFGILTRVRKEVQPADMKAFEDIIDLLMPWEESPHVTE